MEITSVNNKQIIDRSRLKDIKNIKKEKMFLVDGYHLVDEAYKRGLLLEVYGTKDETYKVQSFKVTDAVLKKLSSTMNPQGIVGVVKVFEKDFDEGNFIILDSLQDPGNLGTIIRTSLAFGVRNILASPDTASLYNDKVIRATQGAMFDVNIKYQSLETAVPKLKGLGYNVLVTSLKAKTNIEDLDKPKKFALVIGNEAKGVSSSVEAMADTTFKIDMKGNMESLNAGIALGISVYELTK